MNSIMFVTIVRLIIVWLVIKIMYALLVLLHLQIMLESVNVLILLMLSLEILVLVLLRLRYLIIIVMLVIFSSVHNVKLMEFVVLVHHHLCLLPAEVLLVSVPILMYNLEIAVSVHLELSKIMDNVPNVHFLNAPNVPQSQLVRHALLLS